MPLVNILILTAIFVFGASFVMFLWLLFAESRYVQKRTIKHRLLHMSSGVWHGQEKIALYRDKALKDANYFIKLTFKLPRVDFIDKMIIASGLAINPSLFIIGSIALGVIMGLVAIGFYRDIYAGIIAGCCVASVPVVLLKMKVGHLRKIFLEQFPEALDLLSRALKSGNALTGAMAIIAEEMPPPVQHEFASVVDEINYGLTMEEAFMNMCERMPITELRFFSIAVLIQKETGGNIAEIMDSIGGLIRERIQFRRHVKALTAEGRLSGVILLILPVAMFVYLYLTNYEYISLLWKEQVGMYMLGGAVVSQIFGAIVIKKMVDIDI